MTVSTVGAVIGGSFDLGGSVNPFIRTRTGPPKDRGGTSIGLRTTATPRR